MATKSSKYDFTKTMRNISYSSDSTRINVKPTEFYGIEVEITPSDKSRLERFFKEETGYYNSLVEGFSSRVRSFPESLLAFDETWQKIYGYVAETRDKLQKYYDSNWMTDLPTFLSTYSSLLKNSTERQILIADLAASPGLLLPIVRKNLALEILKHYQEQAQRILATATNANTNDGDVYKIAPEMLELVDTARKRHLQIPKNGFVISWNAEKEITELRCGYVASPIIVPKINLIESSNWNTIMIHQEPGRNPNPQTPWIIDVRKSNSNYLLKYLDVKHPHRSASFDLNKKRA